MSSTVMIWHSNVYPRYRLVERRASRNLAGRRNDPKSLDTTHSNAMRIDHHFGSIGCDNQRRFDCLHGGTLRSPWRRYIYRVQFTDRLIRGERGRDGDWFIGREWWGNAERKRSQLYQVGAQREFDHPVGSSMGHGNDDVDRRIFARRYLAHCHGHSRYAGSRVIALS